MCTISIIDKTKIGNHLSCERVDVIACTGSLLRMRMLSVIVPRVLAINPISITELFMAGTIAGSTVRAIIRPVRSLIEESMTARMPSLRTESVVHAVSSSDT